MKISELVKFPLATESLSLQKRKTLFKVLSTIRIEPGPSVL